MTQAPALSTTKSGQIYVGHEFRDSYSFLDVVFANQFEGDVINPQTVEQTEDNFYRGAPPTWLNFYISEKAKSSGIGTSLIKRDGYDVLKQQIRKKRKGPGTSTVNLSHEQGCGGTTLAMQVLWDLRKTFRCAALTSPTSDLTNIVKEVVHLFTAGSHGSQNTVLLLMNDELILDSLKDRIMKEIAEQQIDIDMPVVIILNCARVLEDVTNKNEHSHAVKPKYAWKKTREVILQRELSETEKSQLNKKNEELRKRYGDKCNLLHGFNIMETNSSQAYINEACSAFKTIKREKKSLKTQLVAFLSLLNAYVPGSYLLKSECLHFLNRKDIYHGGLSLKDQMKPFSDLIITFQQDAKSEERVRMAHPLIASYCVELLAEAGVTRSDTARNLLTCLCTDEVCPCLLGFIKDMLTKREVKKDKNNGSGKKREDEDHERFSRLILDIEKMEDESMSASVLKVASDKFVLNSMFPQALARFYYSEIQDYNRAEKWAKTAIERDPDKSFIADTLGQVHKNHLRKMDSKATPREILQLAKKAIEAFEKEEQLAYAEHAKRTKEDGMAKVSWDLNTRGMFGFLQVCNILYDLLVDLSDTWKGVLTKTVSLGSVLELLGDNKLFRFSEFINSLRDKVEKKFEFFSTFSTYSDPIIKKSYALYIPRVTSECYRKYVGDSEPKHKEQSDKTIQKLKEKLAAHSAGVLSVLDRSWKESVLNEIALWWEELCLREDATRNALVNYIFTNIMLANANGTTSSSDYQSTFRKQMPLGLTDAPEFHMLALLICWPTDDEDKPVFDLQQLIRKVKHSYEREYQALFQSRYLRPLFFIGEGKSLSRHVHRRVLEILWTQDVLQNPNTNWRSQKIFRDPNVQERLLRVQGVVRNYKLYATFGGTEIELDVNRRDSLWKPGQVSFYVGFTISGPVAYDIKRRTTFEEPVGELEACSGVGVNIGWTKLRPEIKTVEGAQTHCLESDAGHYECSVSALRWVCKEKVAFTFQFSSWEEHMRRPECMDFMPAGPLLDITVSDGEIEEMHFPHWIDHPSTPSDQFVVFHVDTCGYYVENVTDVASSHVKLNQPTFSPRGVMIRKRLGLPVKVYYDTLIYRQTSKEFLTLHVYLVPPDPDVQQTVERKETSYRSIIIPKPSPDKSLQMQDHFLLTANMSTADINPDKLKLQYDRRNFFEVFIRKAESDFSLTLTSKQKKNGRQDTVWTCTIRKGDYMNESSHDEEDQHFVDRHWLALVQRVSRPGEILDQLLHKKLISNEQWDTMRALKTPQQQTREIVRVVTSAGKRGKDTLYEILEKTEKPLIEDLKRST